MEEQQIKHKKEIRVCICGCSQKFECSEKSKKRYIPLHCQKYMHLLKGKTWEEIYGIEGAKIHREKRRHTRLGKKLNRIKPSYKKGKKYNEIYGEERTKQILDKIHQKCLQTIIWSKQEIIDEYLKLPYMRKGDWNYYRKKTNLIPDSSVLKKLFGNFKNFENVANKKFLPNFKREYRMIGENENIILDFIEKEKNIKLERNFKIYIITSNGKRKKYFIDGYDKENNVVYEVYEYHHKYNKLYDIKREYNIKNKLKCEFIILNENEYLEKINEKNGVKICITN